jgi:hypothetical protein
MLLLSRVTEGKIEGLLPYLTDGRIYIGRDGPIYIGPKYPEEGEDLAGRWKELERKRVALHNQAIKEDLELMYMITAIQLSGVLG